MTPPRFAVVIPLFNGELFLKEALDSVAAQTVPADDVIVVDDGSTDGGAAIARSFPGATLIQQENRGVSAARNAGIARSSTEYLAFLDADDIWLPHKTERQLAIMRDAKAQLVTCLHRHYIQPGVVIPGWMHRVLDREGDTGGTPSGWLARRDAFDSVGLFDETIHLGEDLDWLARVSDGGLAIRHVREELVVRRIHGQNATVQHTDEARAGMLSILRASVHRKQGQSPPSGGG